MFDCNRTRDGADQEVSAFPSRADAERAKESKPANSCLVGREAFPGEATWVTSDVILPSPCIPDDMFVESENTKHGDTDLRNSERW